MKKTILTLIGLTFSYLATAQFVEMDPTFGQYQSGAARMYFRDNGDEVNAVINYGSTYNYIAGSTQKYNGNWDFVFAGFYETEYITPSDEGRLYIDFGGDDHAMAMSKGGGNNAGRVYLAGYTTNAGVTKFALARVTGAGWVDTSFSNNTGKVITAIGNSDDKALAVTVQQADGKIILAGYTTTASGKDFALTRYLEDGSLDTTFGTNGVVITDFNGGEDQANAVVLLSSGKILAGGFATIAGQKDFAVARYNTNGSLDTTFNTTGKLTTNYNGNDRINALVYDTASGAIYGAGASGTTGNLDFALLNYGDTGLNTSFDTDGIVTTAVGAADDEANGLFFKNGSLLVTGSTYNGTFKKSVLAKYSAVNGSLTTAFGTNGIIIQSIGNGDDIAKGVVVKDNNEIYIAGTGDNGCNNDAFLTGYNNNGQIIEQLGYNGKWFTDFDFSSYNVCYDMVIGPDNKIIQVGGTNTNEGYASTYTSDFAIAKWNADGSPDTSFNGCGRLVKHAAGNSDYYNSVALQPDGKIIAAGQIGSDNSQFIIDRYNADGTPDTTFANQGSLTITGIYDNVVTDIKVASNGKIYFSGARSYYKNCIISLNANGSFNYEFNGSAKVDVTLLNSSIGGPLEIQADGKIVFATAGSGKTGLARFNPDGTPDTTFGGTGSVTNDIGFGIKTLLIQPDGKILLGGVKNTYSNVYAAVVMRYNADGTVDTTFSGDGIYYSNATGVNSNSGYIALQPDNKIIVAADSGVLLFWRLHPDGSNDETFDLNPNPSLFMDYTEGTDYVQNIGIQDGKLLMSGYSFSLFDNAFTLGRMNVGDVGTPVAAAEEFEAYDKSGITVYPNPVNEVSLIDFELKESAKGSIELYDITGKKVATLCKDKIFASGRNTEKLNLPVTLASGVYILTVKTNAGTKNIKILK